LNPAEVIALKRDGGAHSPAEISAWIAAYVRGEVGDEQMAAWAMAVYLNGMNAEESAALTAAMIASGETLKRGADSKPRVDKHSTGGVGDKVSIVLAPLLACCGVDVPMISGRGLGASGGTLDKLESIPGFRADLDFAEIDAVLAEVGCVITGTTADMVPADRRLYALRDVTGTVPSVPLIVGSILSKKIAEDLDALVLDVKAGSGAFMKTPEQARVLADALVEAGEAYGVSTSARITDMSQPLGRAVGHTLEIDESVAALEGRGPEDLMQVTMAFGIDLLTATGVAGTRSEALESLEAAVRSGAGREALAKMVAAQGGDLDAPRAVAEASDVPAERSGHVAAIDCEALGLAALELGGGRKHQGDIIDHSVGLEMCVRVGDAIDAGDPLLRVYGDRASLAPDALAGAIRLEEAPVDPLPLILE